MEGGTPKSPQKMNSVSPSNRPAKSTSIQRKLQLSPGVNKHEIGEVISEIDRENLELKMNLMQAKDQADDLATKAQKEKAKNVKAVAETEQLRIKHAQTAEQNRTLSLKVKNLEARLEEMDRKTDAVRNMPLVEETEHTEVTADHLKSQITKLKEQNLTLLNKLDAQKSRSICETKAKEEQVIMLNEKLMKIREENDMLFSGDIDPDVLREKLLREKKSLEQRIANTKSEANDQMKELQATMDKLSKANADLKRQVGKATLEINEDDDEEIRRAKEIAQAIAKTGIKNAARAKRASIQINAGTHDSREGGFGLHQLSALANKSISGLAL
jgi:chromosome segregation ATPase